MAITLHGEGLNPLPLEVWNQICQYSGLRGTNALMRACCRWPKEQQGHLIPRRNPLGARKIYSMLNSMLYWKSLFPHSANYTARLQILDENTPLQQRDQVHQQLRRVCEQNLLNGRKVAVTIADLRKESASVVVVDLPHSGERRAVVDLCGHELATLGTLNTETAQALNTQRLDLNNRVATHTTIHRMYRFWAIFLILSSCIPIIPYDRFFESLNIPKSGVLAKAYQGLTVLAALCYTPLCLQKMDLLTGRLEPYFSLSALPILAACIMYSVSSTLHKYDSDHITLVTALAVFLWISSLVQLQRHETLLRKHRSTQQLDFSGQENFTATTHYPNEAPP